jgi:hypothetical protein
VKRLATPVMATPVMAITIFVLNLWLNAPLFMRGDLPFRGSIEGGYVGMARFLSQHPNPWGWNPIPYCGLPTQFMYVPGVLYFSALWMRLLPHASPDAVYRTIVSLMTCLGPVTLFLFARYMTGSPLGSFLMALGYSFLSPSYALFPEVEKDRGIVQLPWRIQVLAKYGEGPHNTALTLLPLALLAVWRAGKRCVDGRGYPRIFLAAILLAAIPLCNWVGAFSLAISCTLLLIAALGEPEFEHWRVAAAGGLAYLLACFWLTPSFIKTIAFNWPVDSFAYQLGNTQVRLLAGMAVGALLVRVAFRVFRGSFYFCFVVLCAFVFGWIATGFYLYGADTIPESRRYAIEFELFLALGIAEALRLSLRNTNSTVRMCAYGTAGVMLLVGAPQLWAYVNQGWKAWLPYPPETTVEYRLGNWLDQHPPEGRVFASGGMRFRVNSWFDLQQVGGGFETGLQNRVPVDLAYDLRASSNLWPGREAEHTVLLLKALGASYIVVHGPKSKEYYRDFVHPGRVAEALTPVYQIEDDTIYALPARPLAHLFAAEEVPATNPREPRALVRYVAEMEDPAYPALQVKWLDPSVLDVTGPAPQGTSIAVQVNADPGWRATQNGREIAITRDALGFMVLHPLAAPAARVELRYHGTSEQRIMAAISAAAWMVAIGAWLGVRRRRNAQAREHRQTRELHPQGV